MCGNAFEALIGAIYLDRGYRACKKFMEERIINQYLNLAKNITQGSQLQVETDRMESEEQVLCRV